MTARYAIYFMPSPATELWRFGSSVIGYDAETGREVLPPGRHAFHAPGAERDTAEPRRYGFHATLKAPFALAPGISEATLVDKAKAFAAQRESFTVPPLRVATIERFIALVPAAANAKLDSLAAECVRAFEPMRAALSEADVARRMAATLTPRQIAHLECWGYPYVFEDFRFHMTLTGPLEAKPRARLLDALRSLYAPVAEPLTVDAIIVARQADRDSRFAVLARFPFREAAA